MQDSFGRTIDYLRISLTDRCNLRCVYCMPEEGVHSLSHHDILRLEEIETIVAAAANLGIKHIRLTGGEPLVRKGVVELVEHIAQTPGIEDVSLTTNGILLPAYAHDLKQAGLSRVNISLDSLDPKQYHAITRRGTLDDVFAGIEAAFEAGFEPVKLNTVVVRELNQDLYAFAELSKRWPLHVRFIEYMPMGSTAHNAICTWTEDDVIPVAEMIDTINTTASKYNQPLLEPLNTNDLNKPTGWGPATYWRFPDARATVGFISSVSQHFCAQCNRLRLTADGKIRPCLFSDTEYDSKIILRDQTDGSCKESLEEFLLQAFTHKPQAHNHKIGTARQMSQVGG